VHRNTFSYLRSSCEVAVLNKTKKIIQFFYWSSNNDFMVMCCHLSVGPSYSCLPYFCHEKPHTVLYSRHMQGSSDKEGQESAIFYVRHLLTPFLSKEPGTERIEDKK
jgi:hypothetical protein